MAATLAAEFVASKFFPAQFRISAEQRLMDFCTNEISILLNNDHQSTENNSSINSFGIPQTALIGNPLRIISLNALNSSSNNFLNWTGSAVVIAEQNCAGRYLAMAAGSTLSIFDLQKGAVLREFHDHDGPITGIAWHRTSPWLLASVAADCTLRLWDLRSHPAQLSLRRTTGPYRRLEYSPDCNYIACAGKIVSIFDLNQYQSVVHMACPSPTTNVCFNPAECLLATASEDRVVRFWDVDTGECVTQSPAFDSTIGKICFPSDGRFLVVNTGQQICCIRWEPFELLSHLAFPIPAQIPLNSHSPPPLDIQQQPISLSKGPQMILLDMSIRSEHLCQLAVLKMDTSKIGTICLATIELEKLEKCGTHNNTDSCRTNQIISGLGGQTLISPVGNDQQTEEELEEEEKEKESMVDQEEREQDDISPESVTTADSMLETLTLGQPHQRQTVQSTYGGLSKKSPLTTPSNRKRPPMIKRGTSSADIGIGGIATPTKANHHFGSESAPIKNRHKKEDGNTPNFSNSLQLGNRRPNRLPIIHHQQQSNNNENGGNSNSILSDKKSLIRRGSSLNDVTEPTNNNTAIMPISSIALANAKNRSRSHAQSNRRTMFASSTASSSSNASSNSTVSSLSGPNTHSPTRRQIISDSVEENLDDFMEIDERIRSSTTKQKNEIQTLSISSTSMRGNIPEYIVEQTTRFEEPHAFAQLLEDYMMEPKCYSMGLNAAFFGRLNVLITHRNNNYVQLALDFLDMVTIHFGDSIRHGLASKEYTIGVDVAAEQRFERCTKCKDALFQIHLNTAFNTERMNIPQKRRFEKEILPRIDNIISNPLNHLQSSNRANQSSFN